MNGTPREAIGFYEKVFDAEKSPDVSRYDSFSEFHFP